MSDPLVLARLFLARHPREAAAALEELDAGAIVDLAESLSDDRVADLLTMLSPRVSADCLQRLATDRGVSVLGSLPRRDAAALLRRLPRRRREELLQAMPTATRLQLEVSLHQPTHRIGAWMDTDPLTIEAGATVQAARNRVRNRDTRVGDLYLVDGSRRLLGLVALHRLLSASARDPVEAVSQPVPGVLRAAASLEAAASEPAWQEVDALPVVDRENRLLGSLRHATLRQALAQGRDLKPDAGGENYLNMANNLYVGLAEVFTTSIAKGQGVHLPASKEGDGSP